MSRQCSTAAPRAELPSGKDYSQTDRFTFNKSVEPSLLGIALAGLGTGGTAIELKTWRVPRAQVPTEREACLAWLDGEWARIDAWIASRIAAERFA